MTHDTSNSPALSRRSLLRLTGAGVLAGAATVGVRAADAQEAAPPAARPDLTALQGNSLVAFGTTAQHLLLVRVPDATRGRAWLRDLRPLLTSCQDVADLRAARVRARRLGERLPRGPWSAVALSAAGLRALDVPAADVGLFPEDFQEGMRARASVVGDVGVHDPRTWTAAFTGPAVHAVVIAAADGSTAARTLAARHRAIMRRHGVTVVGEEIGAVRADEPDHEHFGFRDGISQPGVRGLTPQHDVAGHPQQGVPGQDLLWSGEFVLGQPTQDPRPGPDGGLNLAPGPVATAGPAWAVDGSFLVLRRLRQDVAGFRSMMAEAAPAVGLTPQQLAAKLVGRWPSGAPVLAAADGDLVDPSVADPTVLAPHRINDFELAGEDPDGLRMPRCAHVRKTYPRDEELATGGEAATQTHRMLRRGIPYGTSFDLDPDPDADRGLLFLAYMTSIARQFEFVQRRWVNDSDLPEAGDGPDPIMATGATSPLCSVPTSSGVVPVKLSTVVTTTGGEYFFQPSLPALDQLAAAIVPRQRSGRRDDDRRRRR